MERGGDIMFQLGLDATIPYEQFREYLEEGNLIYVDQQKLLSAANKLEVQAASRLEQLTTLIYGVRTIKLFRVTKQDVINYMIDYGVPEQYFCARGKSEPVYYNEKVRTKILSNGYINDVFLMYESYLKLRKEAKNIRNIMDRAVLKERIPGNQGQPLVPIDYKVVPTKNLRFSTKEENAIGFYGDPRSSFTAPDDFYILSADFPQIDGKAALNLYMKNDHLDYLTSQVDDTYLLFKEYARYIDHEHDKRELENSLEKTYYVNKDELEERIRNHKPEIIPFANTGARDIYKVTALKTAFYSRHSSIREENKAIRKLTRMYESSERYHRILAMTTLMHDYRIPIEISSRWGNRRLILEQDLRATLSSVFNAPIQTTSSEAVISYVVHFLDYFRDNNIGPEDVRICLNRHDEPIFYIRKAIFEEHIHFIAGMRTYLIEGWQPIKLDMYVGESYKKNDKHAIELLNSVPSQYERALTIAQQFKNQEEPYTLFEPHIVSVAHMKVDSGTMRVAFVWQDGPLVDKLSLTDTYVDRRKTKVKILSFNTLEEEMTEKILQLVVNQFSNTLENDGKSLLVFAPTAKNSDIILDNRTAYFRCVGGTAHHFLALGALVAAKLKDNPEDVTPNERRYYDYLEENKGVFMQ